jgi:hypothetical protein
VTPARCATRTATRTAAALLAAALASGCASAPHGSVATGTRPAGGVASGSGAVTATKPAHAARLRHRVRPDVVVISRTPLSAAAIAGLRRTAPGGIATFRSGRVRLGSHSLDVAGVDAGTFRSFAPQGTAESDPVWDAVARGDLVVSHAVAKARHIKLGARAHLGRSDYLVAAFASTGLPGIGALVGDGVADSLRLPRPNAAVLSAGSGDPTVLAAAVRRVAGPRATIHLLTQPKMPSYAFLTGSSAAKAFGAFSYRWFDDGTIQPDAAWVRANIVTTYVPILGTVTCHRLMIRQLRGALAQIQAAGLASLIHSYDGCYVPRFIEHDPTSAVSLHTWGIAIDIDAATNQRGGRGTMDPRVVAVFKQWGFRWGGDWSYTDPMHFEIGALLQ